LTLAAAALVELLQSPLDYRTGDFWDFVAGGAGALLVAAAVAALARRAPRQARSD
jgi:hypothetical protein